MDNKKNLPVPPPVPPATADVTLDEGHRLPDIKTLLNAAKLAIL